MIANAAPVDLRLKAAVTWRTSPPESRCSSLGSTELGVPTPWLMPERGSGRPRIAQAGIVRQSPGAKPPPGIEIALLERRQRGSQHRPPTTPARSSCGKRAQFDTYYKERRHLRAKQPRRLPHESATSPTGTTGIPVHLRTAQTTCSYPAGTMTIIPPRSSGARAAAPEIYDVVGFGIPRTSGAEVVNATVVREKGASAGQRRRAPCSRASTGQLQGCPGSVDCMDRNCRAQRSGKYPQAPAYERT